MTVPRPPRPDFSSPPSERVPGSSARGETAGRRGASGRLRPTVRDGAMLAWATRFGRLNSDQARRWFYGGAPTAKAAQNRLCELAGAGLFVRVPLRRDLPGLYVPTPAGARASGTGLSAPSVPGIGGGAIQAVHALTVAEVARWLLEDRAAPGAAWLTARELLREAALALPVGRRAGGRGLLAYVPDGALVLPTGERIAVEVELTDKAGRLAGSGGKLAWYRDAAGYAGVLWLTRGRRGLEPLARAIAATGCAGLMRVESLPAGLPVWAG